MNFVIPNLFTSSVHKLGRNLKILKIKHL